MVPAPGTITGGVDGVMINGAYGNVSNYNSIAGFGAAGVYLKAGGVVNNAQGGTITGSSTVSNDGSSTGLGAGVYVATGAGMVNNLGTIIGTGTSGIGVYLKAGGAVANGAATVNTAIISGSRIGVVALAAGTMITNFGTISGGSGTPYSSPPATC
jgi:hypothetical protein